MSKPMPKRLVDLSLQESDSDDPDFKTPIKKRTSKALPKKTSELTVVNSESEEEEDKDNLNCAINLNDSFIFTPSKLIFTPMKLEDPPAKPPVAAEPIEKKETRPPRAENVLPISKSSIFSLTSVQENDKNLPNLKKLVLTNVAPPALIKSQSTSALGTQATTLGLKKKTLDDHVDIIRYRPINQKRLQEKQKQEPKQEKTTSSGRKSSESVDSGISSSVKVFPNSGSIPDVPDTVLLPKVSSEPVFATPGFQKTVLQITGSRRMANPRMPLTSATKSQSSNKEEFQQRKVLFTTPMGGPGKAVPSLPHCNSNISLALDNTILASRLPEVSEVQEEKKAATEFQEQVKLAEPAKGQESRQVRRIKNADYAVEKKIGHGGSSTVFLGRRLDTGQEVALKVVDLQGDEAIIRGYLKETELLASLQGNPNIITLFDYYHSDKESLLYMVMEKGETDLHKILQTYTSDIPLYRLLRYWYEMLLAVEFIHKQGVIHLDLKPANFLMVGGRLKLIDFGIAAKINSDATSIVKESQAGTFNYISPEALTDTSDESSSQHPKFKISTKSDVWSLGCILYSLIYKRTPFAHLKRIQMKMAAITNPKTDIDFPELPIYYPPFLIKMLKTCLKHNPKERASVQDLLKFPYDMIIPID